MMKSSLSSVISAESLNQPLPEDMVIAILEILPVKPLLRFKCVSKSWCKLIKSPRFANSHFHKERNNNNDNVLLVMHRLWSGRMERVLSFHDLDSPELEHVRPDLPIPEVCEKNFGFVLLGPCNGIVCLVSYRYVILYNPALRDIKYVPHCPFARKPGVSHDYSKVVCRRWGFCNTINGFTVVQLQCTYPRRKSGIANTLIEANLYDSATNSWRQIDDKCNVNRTLEFSISDIFNNGACHWSVNKVTRGCAAVILTLDMSDEVFRVLECPYCSSEPNRNFELELKVFDECLSMIWYAYFGAMEIWVMKEYGVKEPWTKHFVISTSSVVRPLLFFKNDHEWLLTEDIYSRLTSYKLHTNDIKRYEVTGNQDSFWALIYKESLITLT